jgi:hypothetical protein
MDSTMRGVLNVSRKELPATKPKKVMASAAPSVSREILVATENLFCTLADNPAGQRYTAPINMLARDPEMIEPISPLAIK